MPLPDYSALGYKEIIAKLDGSILILVMNRAKQRNTYNKAIVKELVEAFELADRDDRVRAVILTAEPDAPAFCSGADISGGWGILWDPEAEKEGEHAHRDGGGRLSVAVYRCRKLTISAINGHAAGVGMTALQLPFDFRFVWAGAKLTFPFVRRGINAEGDHYAVNPFPIHVNYSTATSTYLLPRLLGHSRASSLLLTGATISPNSPYIEGLYHEILPTREEVFPAAKAFAEELVANTSQPAVAYTKGLMQHPGDSIEENHLLDSRGIRLLGASKDGAEGVQSFLERRAPKFTETLSTLSSPFYPWWRRLDINHLKSKL